MPHYPIGKLRSINSPYCIKNYVEVNPELGNLNNLRNLVNEAHKRNIAVIVDWVANHTSWDHDWISNKAWYTQDANGNIIHPAGTNWQDVADLNFDNTEMRLAMIKAMKFWIENALIDGFRCDAADFVPFDFWKQAIDSIRAIPNRKILMFAEGERKNHVSAGFNMFFGWDFYGTSKQVFSQSRETNLLFEAHNREYNGLPANVHPVRFITNHDENAFVGVPQVLYGGAKAAIAAFATTAYLGGVPLIYNGQEVGCETMLPIFSNVPINWNKNTSTFQQYKQIMAIRNNNSALRIGSLSNFSSQQIIAFTRKAVNNNAFVLINTQNLNVVFTVPNNLDGTIWKNEFTQSFDSIPASINLKPFEIMVFTKD